MTNPIYSFSYDQLAEFLSTWDKQAVRARNLRKFLGTLSSDEVLVTEGCWDCGRPRNLASFSLCKACTTRRSEEMAAELAARVKKEWEACQERLGRDPIVVDTKPQKVDGLS